MPTENHIIIDKGVSLHPETNTGQVYDYNNSKWLDQVITDIQNKPVVNAWDDLQGKPTSFPPSSHEHPISQVTGLETELQEIRGEIPEQYTLPIASSTVLGGIKPDGTTITVDPVTGIARSSSTNSSTVNLTPNSNNFTELSVGSNYAIKYDKLVTLSIDVTSKIVISAESFAAVSAVGIGYTPKSPIAVGYSIANFSGKDNIIPIRINSGGSIVILSQDVSIPAGTRFTGNVSFATS